MISTSKDLNGDLRLKSSAIAKLLAPLYIIYFIFSNTMRSKYYYYYYYLLFTMPTITTTSTSTTRQLLLLLFFLLLLLQMMVNNYDSNYNSSRTAESGLTPVVRTKYFVSKQNGFLVQEGVLGSATKRKLEEKEETQTTKDTATQPPIHSSYSYDFVLRIVLIVIVLVVDYQEEDYSSSSVFTTNTNS